MSEPSEALGRNWRRLRERAYQQWLKQEGIPVHTGSFVRDLHRAEVGPWARFGQKGAVISLADQEVNDGWLIEVTPGGKTEPVHHLCEATIYVVEGQGATAIWQPGATEKQTVEWQTGSLFSPPMNAFYQHFNLDGSRPARLFAATTAPLLMNAMRNSAFVFDCPFVFRDRYAAERDYFTDPGRRLGLGLWQTNFIPDLRTFGLDDHPERGPGASNMFFAMANNATSGCIAQFPTGTYLKAHRHGPGAEIIILSGSGYSLLWHEGHEWQKVDWSEGTMVSPRDQEYHQHFNTGPEPARYVAFIFNHLIVNNLTEMLGPGGTVSQREGGWQVDYEDEDPRIYELFERECQGNSAEVTLPRPAYRGDARWATEMQR